MIMLKFFIALSAVLLFNHLVTSTPKTGFKAVQLVIQGKVNLQRDRDWLLMFSEPGNDAVPLAAGQTWEETDRDYTYEEVRLAAYVQSELWGMVAQW